MNQFISEFKNIDMLIRNSYKEFGIRFLFDYKCEGQKALTFYTKKLDNAKPYRFFNSFEFFNELSFISDDIAYFTALTHLLRPYINNPLKENKTYIQRFEDERYMTYANILFQTFYNYWDRIGDFVFAFLETSIYERNVYFSSVLSGLNPVFKESDNYKKLYSLYDEKLKSFFDKRHKIVHYIQLSASIYSGTFLNYNDENKLIEIQTYKESLPDLFKENIEYTFQGFEYAVRLINEKASKIHNDFSFNKLKD